MLYEWNRRSFLQSIKSLMAVTSDNNLLKKSYLGKTKYFKDFILLIESLSQSMSDKELDDCLRNKLQLGKASFGKEAYFEAATELSVVSKIHSIPHDSFTYEKPVKSGTKKNPECTITNGVYTVNCEAKCPRIPKIEEPDNSDQKVLVMQSAGRVPAFFDQFAELKEQLESNDPNLKMVLGKNKDNTMKDFLQSAHEKFADFRDENELNVLFVSLDDVHNIQDWWNYLHQHQGLLTRQPFEIASSYSRVDVVIFTNLLFRHKNPDRINGSAWSLDESFNLFLSNGHRQAEKKNAHYFLIPHIQNFTEEMKKYNVPGDVDKDILEALKISWFVKEKLEKENNSYFFEKQIDT